MCRIRFHFLEKPKMFKPVSLYPLSGHLHYLSCFHVYTLNHVTNFEQTTARCESQSTTSRDPAIHFSLSLVPSRWSAENLARSKSYSELFEGLFHDPEVSKPGYQQLLNIVAICLHSQCVSSKP